MEENKERAFTAWKGFAKVEGEGKKERQLKLFPRRECSSFAGVFWLGALYPRRSFALSLKKAEWQKKWSFIAGTFMTYVDLFAFKLFPAQVLRAFRVSLDV